MKMEDNFDTASERTLSVLLIDDSEVDRLVVEGMLKFSSLVSCLRSVAKLEEATGVLTNQKIDVVILDLNLEHSSGEDTLVRFVENFPEIAIVVNTGMNDVDLGLRMLRIGSQDFLIKGQYNSYTLQKSLQYAVERKAILKELGDRNEQLRILQEQLIQIEKMKVIGQLASGVAHEVRNPLSTFSFGLTYLSEQIPNLTDEIKSVLSTMKDAATRANAIISDLLNFASISKLQIERTDIDSQIEKAITLVQMMAQPKSVRIEHTRNANLPVVSIDMNRIQQVMVNILLNAIGAMPRGGCISVSSRRVEKDELPVMLKVKKKSFAQDCEYIKVCFEDEGCGIPEAYFSKIFEPFFTTRRHQGGVGLGLPVCQHIMDMHYGGIVLTNRLDKGVCAALYFPV